MCAQKLPYEIKRLDPETSKKLRHQYSDDLSDLIQIGPQKVILTHQFIREASYCHDFPLRPNDVFVMGYPRSGLTMTQELLWLVFNQFNFKMAAEKKMVERVPVLEKAVVGKKNKNPGIDSAKILKDMTTRRVIKSHLHIDFLPKEILTSGCKIIYIARNPKQVAVSFYHYQHALWDYKESFETYLELFLSDLTLYAPYWAHLQQAWQHRSSPNVFFLFYEDFVQNRRDYIEKLLKFVDEEVTPFQLDLLDFFLEFKNFKNYISQGVDKHLNTQEDINDHFVREGNAEDWKKYFTAEMNLMMNKWIEENLARIGIEVPEGFYS